MTSQRLCKYHALKVLLLIVIFRFTNLRLDELNFFNLIFIEKNSNKLLASKMKLYIYIYMYI